MEGACEGPSPANGPGGSVVNFIREDSRLITGRPAQSAAEAGFLNPTAVAAPMLLLYTNGVLGSLLRGATANPLIH